MAVRQAVPSDFDCILSIYSYAREQMKAYGNPSQWGDSRPSPETVKQDIENEDLYVIEENGRIDGVFAFITGDDPTYQTIEGKWLNDLPYGTIHRIAAGSQGHHIFRQCLSFCEALLPNIRIDTHEHNIIMRRLLANSGFQICGIIYVADGTPRIAYQKTCPPRTNLTKKLLF